MYIYINLAHIYRYCRGDQWGSPFPGDSLRF